MTRRSSVVFFALALVLSCMIGCSDSTSPVSEKTVQLNLEATEYDSDGQSYFKVIAQVDNASGREIFHTIGCPHAVLFSVVNEHGESVLIANPLVDLLCLPGYQSVSAGDASVDELDLQSVWSISGSPQDLSPGTYTVNASFEYFWVPEETSFELKQSLEFEVE